MHSVNHPINRGLIQALTAFFLKRDEIQLRRITETVTKRVGAGKDFATIQAAINWFAGKVITTDCYIDVDAGTYTEDLVLQDVFCVNGAKVIIRGDTNTTSGYSCVIGSATRSVPGNRLALANLGTGNVTAAVGGGGTTLTITMSTTNPAFDTAKVNSSVRYYDAATGNNGTFTLTDVVGGVLTVGGADTWPAGMANLGSAVCFLPNRILEGHITMYDGAWALQGFVVHETSGDCITLETDGVLELRSCFVYGSDSDGIVVAKSARVERSYYNSVWENTSYGVRCGTTTSLRFGGGCDVNYMAFVDNGNTAIRAVGAVTVLARYAMVVGGSYGVLATGSASVYCQYAVAVAAATIGFCSSRASHVDVTSGIALSCQYGYYIEVNAAMTASSCTAQGNTTGYYARTNAYMYANSTVANNNGNGTDYSPAVTDTEGNVFGIISFT